jgi:methylmalonyl-CoA/ethylmalonyl-CoA epimerase
MGIEGLLKVGIAVKNLEEATKLLSEAFGLTPEAGETYEPYSMRYNVSNIGDVLLELIEPTEPHGPIAEFIRTHGEGLQHISLEVSNIEEVMSDLKGKGIQFVHEAPMESDAALGKVKFAFVRPKVFHGVLVQLMEMDEASKRALGLSV